MDTPASHRTGTEPIFNLPATVLAWILIMLGVHAVRTWLLSEATDVELLIDWAFVPLRWTAAYGGLAPGDILATLALEPSQPERSLQLELAQYVLSEGAAKPWTGLTYAFLHGSWAHVALNSIWLAAFGTPVARRCGGLRFSFLAALTAVGGALAYVVVHPYQALPLVGASAAVSGMMAAAAWFMFAPISLPGRWPGVRAARASPRAIERACPQPERPLLSRRLACGELHFRGPGAAPRPDRCQRRLGGAYRRLRRRPCVVSLIGPDCPQAVRQIGLKPAPIHPIMSCRVGLTADY